MLNLCPSVWIFARRWLASRCPSPSTLGPTSPSPWTPGGKKSQRPRRRIRPHQRTLRRDARRREELLRKKLNAPTVEKVFKCDQCDNTFKSENGLKIHVGKSHKNLNSTPATPDCLRQQPGSSVSLSASPLLDTSREESSPTSPISGGRTCTCSNLNCCGCYHDDSCECRQTNKITAFCDCEDVDPSHGDCNKQFKTK